MTPSPGGSYAPDEVDERILWELVRDARIPNNALAARAGVSPSTCIARVRKLQESGVLESAHAEINYAAVGLSLRAMCFIRIRAQARQDATGYASRLVMLAPVISVFQLGGAYDFLVYLVCTSSDQLRDFVAKKISSDPNVVATTTEVVFDHYKGVQHMDHFAGFEDPRRRVE